MRRSSLVLALVGLTTSSSSFAGPIVKANLSESPQRCALRAVFLKTDSVKRVVSDAPEPRIVKSLALSDLSLREPEVMQLVTTFGIERYKRFALYDHSKSPATEWNQFFVEDFRRSDKNGIATRANFIRYSIQRAVVSDTKEVLTGEVTVRVQTNEVIDPSNASPFSASCDVVKLKLTDENHKTIHWDQDDLL